MNTYFSNKGYRILTNASLLNAIGNSLYNIVFIVYASTLPFNTLAVSLASIAIFIPSFFQPFLGHLADRITNKLKWNILAKLAQFVLFLLLAGLILLKGSLILFFILLLINVLGDCLGFFSGALQLPYIKHLVPEENLMEAMGFQNALYTLIQLIFQGLGGFAIVQLNYNFSLFALINAITFLMAALIIIRHFSFLNTFDIKSMTKSPLEKTSFRKDFKETIHLLIQNPFLKIIMFFAVLINLLSSSSDGLLNISLLHREYLWFSNLPNTLALISMSSSIGLLLGALFTKDFFKKVSTVTIINLVLLNAALLPISFILIQSKILLLILLFTLGYLLGKINPRISAYIISEVPQEQLGLTSGIFNTLVMVGAPLGQLVFLGSANLFNDTLSWFIFGSLSVIFLIISNFYGKKVTDPISVK